MNQIELYDILTLSDNKEYTVLRMLDLDDKRYCLLSEVDKEENPMIDNLKIFEITSNKVLNEITDATLLTELTELFISALDADL